jgi:Ca2+-binding EF-hand superfamily protein
MKAKIMFTTVACAMGFGMSLVADPALAQEVGGSNQRLEHLMERFHRADANNDGHLTREEARKGLPRVYAHFSEIDTANKGYVTLEQITTWLEAHPGPRARGAPPP